MGGMFVNRTMLIGLGGQGQTALAAVKQRMLEAYGQIPPVVKFLAIDSTDVDQETERVLPGQRISAHQHQGRGRLRRRTPRGTRPVV